MKRKLLFAAIAVLLGGLGSAKADVDYTSAFANANANWTGNTGVKKNATPSCGGVTMSECYYEAYGTEFAMKQTGYVPNGTYDVEVYAQAHHAWLADFNASTMTNVNTLYVNDKTYPIPTVDNTGFADNEPSLYTFTGVAVTDGTLTITLNRDAEGANWFTMNVKSVTLKTSAEDYTNRITNADFSDATWNTGWSGTGTNKAQAFVKQTNSSFTGAFAEMWVPQSTTMSAGDLNQTITLPAGVYTLTAKVQAGVTCYLYASIDNVEQKHTCYGSTSSQSLTFVVKEDNSSVKIGLRHDGATTPSAAVWVAVDDFKLAREGDVGTADLTSQIANWDFVNCSNGNFPGWTIDASTGNRNKYSDTAVEYWVNSASSGSFDYYQNLAGLPNGKYTISASMWNTKNAYGSGSDATGECGVYGTSAAGSVFAGVTKDSDGANLATYTTDGIIVTDNALRLGVKNNETMKAQWFGVDWIKLNFLGATLINDAESLPEDGMAADTWYYFDVETAGGYRITATTLGDIVYTTDGTILTADAATEVTSNFSAVSTLEKTRYYVKSASAQTLTYEIDTYDLTAEIEAYNTAISNANTAKATADAAAKLNAAEKAALETAITNYGSIDTAGDQNSALKAKLEEATTALTTTTNAVNTSIAAYANAKTYLDAMESVLASTNLYTASAYETNYPIDAYNNGTLSDDVAAALSFGSRETGNMPALLLSPWTATGTKLYINTWSNEGNTDGSDFKTPFFEYWTGDGNSLAANTFTCTLDGLAGSTLYSIDILARIRQRNGNAKADNGITLKVGGDGTAVDLTQGSHLGTTRFFLDTFTAYGKTDSEGTLTITITVAENSNISWFSFKNVKYAIANDATALAKAAAKVTALNGKVPTNVYNEAYKAVTDNESPADYETAVSAIVSAAATASAYVDAYADYLELKEYADALVAVANDNTTANNTLSTAITTAATGITSVTSVNDVETVTSTLKDAMVTYAAAANPVGDDAQFDLTFMLTDANMDDCVSWEGVDVNGITGWQTEQQGGNFQAMENNTTTNGDYHSFMEYYYLNNGATWANSKFNLYTTVTLSEGTYTMSCYAFAKEANYASASPVAGVYFYANDTKGSCVSSATLTEQSISFVNGSEQEVRIGLKPLEGNTYNWMGLGYVKLYKQPAQVIDLDENVAYTPESKAGTVELKKTIYSGFNTLVLPFGVDGTTVTAQFGEGSLYKFTDADAGTLNFESATAIEPHVPYLFKSTAADGTQKTYTFEGVTISTGTPVTTGTDYNFVGTYTPYAKGAEENPIVVGADYVLGDDAAFHKTTVKNALKAFRAYIQANEATAEGEAKQALAINIDGLTTAIEAIDGEKVAANGAIYNLAGQRVEKAQRGIYIVNGKKVAVK